MLLTGIVLLLGTFMVASPLLTLRAAWLHSWVMMWVAALISLLVGSVAIFSIGAVVFLLTNLQVAVTYVLRRGLTRTGAVPPLLLAVLLWTLIVPVQVYGPAWFGGFGYLPLVEMSALFLLLLPLDWTARRTELAQ
jgi:hypothetical protein